MRKIDLSNVIAMEMDKAINSEENKALFSTASTIEKLAFKRVSEEDVPGEIEQSLMKCASCKCEDETDHKAKSCDCECHEKTTKSSSPVLDAFNTLLKISESLDEIGFDKTASETLLLAGELIKEAKAKKEKKSEKPKSDAKKSKMSVKERMDKMRKMKGKDSKKSTEKSKSSPAKSSDTKSAPKKK